MLFYTIDLLPFKFFKKSDLSGFWNDYLIAR